MQIKQELQSAHTQGEIIHDYWVYIGEKRSVECYEIFESRGHVCVAHDDIEKPHEILRERYVYT